MVLFFFFKQKTAYEMRISDGSSDVCSSDLDHPGDIERIRFGRHADSYDESTDPINRISSRKPSGVPPTVARLPFQHLDRTVRTAPIGQEIGRASCREGVCQYV